jgi:type II secretory pathway pseudopilin PulG
MTRRLTAKERPPHLSRGFTLSEAVVALAFIGVITTSMLIIATKGFRLSTKGIDMAAAYQVCETIMESYASTAQKSETFWASISPVTAPTVATRKNENFEDVDDTRFCYTVSVTDVGPDLKKVQVRVFLADPKTGGIDTSKPRGGELFRLTNFLPKPANASETSGG